MSQEYKGFVAKIGEKQGKGKNGRPWTVYSCRVEQADGTEYPDWFSLGFEAPKFKQGDYVKFTAAKNERGYLAVDEGSVQVAKNPPARAGKRDEGAKVGGGSSHGNSDFNRQTNPEDAKRMSWANARGHAVELLGLMSELDALTLSSGTGAAAKVKRHEEVLAIVDKLTVKFYNDSITLRLLETVADTAVDTKPDGELPSKDDEKGDDSEGETDDDF